MPSPPDAAPTSPPPAQAPGRAARAEREAAALRANLLRRKQQARARRLPQPPAEEADEPPR